MAPIALHQSLAGINLEDPPLSPKSTTHDDCCSKRSTTEPIAVVGFSFKFPQEATSVDGFWDMLKDKRCAMTEWPKDRLNIDAFYHPDRRRLDTIPFRGGHFLDEALGNFDAPFFSITSAEAAAMDPQQRLLLETAYRALENAGIPLEKVSGSNTSVHTGCFTDDYRLAVSKDPSMPAQYTATGVAPSMLAARLSWFFNFIGPCVNLDSACSSGMMAFNLACQGLRSKESNMAMVGGANIALALDMSLPLSNMNFVSPDSRSFSFDQRANGYGRGEGFGVILLKRLTDAITDGDTIRAVVRATGSNQDGHTPGITQPSADSQIRLIRETYRKANLEMQPTMYVEAHGTGTPMGDPIEARAINTAFRDARSSKEPLYIGAVKSNIGHLEGASGIAGIIKTILVLEAAAIPPNANFEVLNPEIDAQSSNLKFAREMVAWPSKGLRRASVMSFGFGGSNSHLVLDDACNFLRLNGLNGNHWSVQDPSPLQTLGKLSTLSLLPKLVQKQRSNKGPTCTKAKLLVWSAADEGGLARLGRIYSDHFSHIAPCLNPQGDATYLEHLSYTLAARRTPLSWKSHVVANSIADLADGGLKMSKAVRTGTVPRLGFVFTGQGAQFARMAQDLLVYPVFQNSMRRSELYMHSLGCQWSLLDELCKDSASSNVNHPAYSQPICTALQIALVDLLRRFGIVPSAVVGHSSGEIAAAYCVGYISHQSACRVAFYRGHCATQLLLSDQRQGAMMAVGLSEADIEPYLEGITNVMVGCVNSARSVTVTGNDAQINVLREILDRKSIFCRKLQVSIAYHSPQMSEIAAEYLTLLGNLEQGDCPGAPPKMISTVTGKQITVVEAQKSTYWIENMASQVKFSAAIEHICSTGHDGTRIKLKPSSSMTQVSHLLEVGPHSALRGPIKDILSKNLSSTISYASVLDRSMCAMDTLLDAVGSLHCSGYPVDICAVNQPGKRSAERCLVLPGLPEYPFDHSRNYWHESRLSKEGYRLRKSPRLDLLGSPVPDWNPLHAQWRCFLRVSEMPWIEDHKINGTVVYPAAGMLVMALEAAKQMSDSAGTIAGYTIKDVTFTNPLIIASDPRGTETKIYLRRIGDSSSKDSSSEFNVCVFNGEQWSDTCRGTIQLEFESEKTEVDGGKEAKARLIHYRQSYEEGVKLCDNTVHESPMYEYMQRMGLEYGPAFQALRELSYSDKGDATGKVGVFRWSSQETAPYTQAHVIHPTTLDALFQLMMVALSRGTEEVIPTIMPTRIGKLWIAGEGVSYPSIGMVSAQARAKFSGRRKAKGGMFAMDETTSKILVSLENTEVTTVASRGAVTQSQIPMKRLCYNFVWRPDLDMLNRQQQREYCESTRPTRPSQVECYEDLDLILIILMSEALSALTEPDLGSMTPHLRRYIEWSRFQIERFHAGTLPRLSSNNSKWRTLLQDTEYRDCVLAKVRNTKQGNFFVKVGSSLLQMLRGQLDPLTFMFQDDSVPEFYREINENVICYEPLNRYLEAMSHKDPGLKVLEIGAGTGATTHFILDALSNHKEGDARTLNCAQYDYTDISPAFFESAATKYGQNDPRMRFKVLDIEKEPSKQGFELGTYDLIIAASVLHATKDLEVTMRNARALLKSGGKLVIFEVTQDVIRARFAFGLLPGWWLSEEGYRQWGPCISIQDWDDLLRRTGFSGADLEIPDFIDERCHEYTIIVSTATERKQDVQTMASQRRQHWRNAMIVVDQNSLIQESIAQRLKDFLVSSASASCRILALEQASSSIDLEDTFCVVLLEMEKPILSTLVESNLAMLQRVVTKVPGLLWVTGGNSESLEDKAQLHLVEGLARVSRTEFNKLMFVTLALEDLSPITEHHAVKYVRCIRQVLEKTLAESPEDFESEYIEKNGMLEIGRVIENSDLNRKIFDETRSEQHKLQEFGSGPPLKLHVASPGSLDSLEFLEADTAQNLAVGELEIRIEATGVNFLDCLTVLGQIDSKTIGGECAGVVTRVGSGCHFLPGDRVVSLATDTYQTYTRASSQHTTSVPDGLSLAEASALPIVFCTAWIALFDTARLQQGETVLIHAGAGGTGQAAIQTAQYLGAEVFVTVGSDEKKKLVAGLYNIAEDHIFYSRDTSFAQGIMRTTNNRGVDVVLNSLSGEGLRASWECLACLGRFVEIGKRDIISHGSLPMWEFRKNVTFSSVDLLTVVRERPSMINKSLSIILALVAEKRLHLPQPFKVFGIAEVEHVFRLFQSGQNSGKMAIEMREEDVVPAVLKRKAAYQFDAGASYLIAGGLGGLGRSAARWMAERGAKHLILPSRSGPKSETSVALLEDLRSSGVDVVTPLCDVTDQHMLSSMLKTYAQSMPRIKGVMQASMVLKDALLEKLTIEDWNLSTKPKVQGSWNLHKLLPRGMDFFICLSSISGIIGSGGQASYAAGNSYMDALVQYRVRSGEKATALDLGWMISEGVVAESASLSTSIAEAGHMVPITRADFHALLDHYCDPAPAQGPECMNQSVIGPEVPAAMLEKGLKEPQWMQRRTFRHLRQMISDSLSPPLTAKITDYAALLREAGSLEAAAQIVIDGLLHKLARALSISPKEIDISKPLHAYGVDSLLAVELRNYFATELSADVAIFDITGGSSFEAVSMTVARKSQFCPASIKNSER